jgi:hypothetical protein
MRRRAHTLPAPLALLPALALAAAAAGCPPVRSESPDAQEGGAGIDGFVQYRFQQWANYYWVTLLLPREENFSCPTGYGYGLWDDGTDYILLNLIRGSETEDWTGEYPALYSPGPCEYIASSYEWIDLQCLYSISGTDEDGFSITLDTEDRVTIDRWDDAEVRGTVDLGDEGQYRFSGANCGEQSYYYWEGDGDYVGAPPPAAPPAAGGDEPGARPERGWSLRFR